MFPTPPDVCLVFLKTWATEGYDRPSLLVDWNGTAVVETVAASCPNTVVITNSGGLNILPFADNPNVTAILAAHYPGQEVGNSIVDILWGAVNPSGKLPYTIALNEDDYAFADITNSTALLNTEDPNAWQSDFEERLLIDYRELQSIFSRPFTPSNKLQVTSTTLTNPSSTSSALACRTPHSRWQKHPSAPSAVEAFLLSRPTCRSSQAAILLFGTTCTA